MINGVRNSQIEQIKKNKINHLKRLQKINHSKSHKYEQSDSFMSMIENRKNNHKKWKNFAKLQQQRKLFYQNQKMFDRLMNLTLDQSPYSYSIQAVNQKTVYRHHNSKVQQKRRMKSIDQQNPELAKRIMEKTGDLNHQRDLENFRKTRQIVNRLQKFQSINRKVNFRCKTLPMRKIKTSEQQIQGSHNSVDIKQADRRQTTVS